LPMLPSPSLARASTSADASSGRWRVSRSATTSSASGCSIRRRQRERMVGSSRPGEWDTSNIKALRGGSSSTFSTALAALRFISSAESMITTRQPPSAGVSDRKWPMPRTSSTTISVFSLTFLSSAQPRSTACRSAWPWAATRRNTGWSGRVSRLDGASPNRPPPSPPPASTKRAKR
jgi:hypothetical protein